jgi:hypothetical protein
MRNRMRDHFNRPWKAAVNPNHAKELWFAARTRKWPFGLARTCNRKLQTANNSLFSLSNSRRASKSLPGLGERQTGAKRSGGKP